jgi:hypothetical protein
MGRKKKYNNDDDYKLYQERYRYPVSIQYEVDKRWTVLKEMNKKELHDHAFSTYTNTRSVISFYIALKKCKEYPQQVTERLKWISQEQQIQ